jgi:hypothetical protein
VKKLKKQNPLCEGNHEWTNLFTAFAVGAFICFSGYLLLQMIYVCFRIVCEIKTTPGEPIAEAPVVAVPPVTLIEMMSMPNPLSAPLP